MQLLIISLLVDAAYLVLQVIEKLESVRVTRQGMPIEVAMTQNFHHLGVLRSIAWGIGQPDPGAADGTSQLGCTLIVHQLLLAA
jgi:hypothetical protein